MGISINFKGVIKDESRFDGLIAELKDICQIREWDYTCIGIEEKKAYPPLKGIVFTLEEKCDPFPILFDPQGTLKSLEALNYYDPHDQNQNTITVKTQFSTPEIHINIIKLLSYLQKKYFDRFEVTDEGGYWDNPDVSRLKKAFETPENTTAGLSGLGAKKSASLNQPGLKGEYIEKSLRQALFPEPDQEE